MKDTADFDERIGKLIEASIATKRAMLGDSQIVSTLAKVCELLINALSQGNKILLFSSATVAALPTPSTWRRKGQRRIWA